MLIKKGTVLCLETGEYSDYVVHGPFRVLRDFDQGQVVAQFKAQWTPPHEWRDEPDPDEFMGWLVSERYIEDIDPVLRWHLGSYGSMDEVQIQDEPSAT